MTWKEIRLAALQKMFSVEGDWVNYSDITVREYLAAMPQAANEAVQLILAAGLAPRAWLRMERAPGDSQTVDLRVLAPDLYRADPLELYIFDPDGTPRRAGGAVLAAGRYLILPRTLQGSIGLCYEAAPEPFGATSPEETELRLPQGAERLLPLYMASQLYKDDDVGIATQYRNEFEVALAMLCPQAGGMQSDEFISEKGWC